MKEVYCLDHPDDFKKIPDQSEIILSPKALSHTGTLSLANTLELASVGKKRGHKVFLDWSAPLNQQDRETSWKNFSSLSDFSWDAIRVQDCGVAQRLLSQGQSVHLLLELGNHNLKSLESYAALGPGVKRLVVSCEIPFDKLSYYKKRLSVPLERLIFGKMLIFHSPRKLLSPHFEEEEQINVQAKSEESHHQGFTLSENEHGTLMYAPRVISLLDSRQDLESIGWDYGRYDLRFDKRLYQALKERDLYQKLKRDYRFHLGFFKVNKTEGLFKKLKNPYLIKNDHFLGEVIGVEKNSFCLVRLSPEACLKPGEEVFFRTPEGKVIKSILGPFKGVQGGSFRSSEQLLRLDFIPKVVKKTYLYSNIDSF